MDFEDGLAELCEVLRFYEDNSVHMQHVDAVYTQSVDASKVTEEKKSSEVKFVSFNYRAIGILISLFLLVGLVGIGWLIWEHLGNDLPIVPAREGETLILVTNFYLAAGIADAEPHRKIARTIEEQIRKEKLTDVRVELEDIQLREDEKEAAQRLAARYNASIIIWGDENSTEIKVQFLNLRQPDYVTGYVTIEADDGSVHKATLANAEPYTQFVNQGLPAQITFLSLFALAQAEYSEEEYANALDICELALKYGEAHNIQGLDRVYFYLSELYRHLTTDIEKSIGLYKQAIKVNPTLAAAYHNLGLAYGEQKMYEQAISNLEQALQLEPATFAGNRQLIEKLGFMLNMDK